MHNNVKVLIVEHSPLCGLLMAGVMQTDPNIKVVEMCKDDADIIQKINLYQPDVVTVDAEISNKGGMECLKKIMSSSPVPVIIMGREEDDKKTRNQAFYHGARDYINKPNNYFDLMHETVKKDLIKKIHTAKNLKYNHSVGDTSLTANNSMININNYNSELINRDNSYIYPNLKNIVAIGISTGGPKTLMDVIPLIPKNLSAAYLIVQHMPAGFTKTFAERLNLLSDIKVKEAEDSEVILAGVAYIAPGGYHMTVSPDEKEQCLRIKLSDLPAKNGVKPSADILFNSLSETGLDNLIGVIMTGMGSDGREGLINMKMKNKAFIIAESEKSCVVYGMPKAVINAGITDRIVPATEITNEIINYMGVDRNGYESIH